MIGYVVGALVVGAATFAWVHTRLPWSQLYGESFLGLKAGTPVLALTFDDGPNDPYTLQLLEVLARHQVPATFFMVGSYVRQRPELARAVAAGGHEIGNHAFSHKPLTWMSEQRVRQEIEDTSNAIEEATGSRPYLFRPPFGCRGPQTFKVARELKMFPVQWGVTCFDWSAKSPEQIVKHARRQIEGGEVILLHDGGHLHFGTDRSNTVAATDQLIGEYKAKGFHFVTITEMMQLRPDAATPY
jgi:peptidoglycan/xylan/chitin deacetylase (PgdA/CDA1 family)